MPQTVTSSLRSASLFCVLVAASIGASAQKAVLSSHVPAIVQNGRAQKTAVLANAEPLSLVINLPLRNSAALEGVLADLYNPQSANFHKWLTPAQFDAQFAPTAEDFAAVVAWAKANNLNVTSTAANRRVVTVQATAKFVNRAFHVTMTEYHDSGLNRDFHAPDVEPTMDLDVPLLSISGLDTSAPRVNHYKKGPVAVSASDVASPILIAKSSVATPKATIMGSGPSNTYLPTDMRPAYYGTGSLTGTGQSVAIFSYDGYLANDLTIYGTKTGMNVTSVPVTNVLTGGFDGGCELDSPCDDGEQILDMLQVMGMAPGLSNIYFYEGLSAVTELNQLVMDDKAAVITSSWGGGDFGPGTTPYFLQMAAQGQTFLNATGDDGAFNSFTYLPPSSDPNIVQVGGTDMYTSSKAGPWASEVAWVDSGGGSYDPSIAIPTWQQTAGVVTSANKASATLRNAPDLAAEANFDNTTVINGTFSSGYGGTSYAAPRMAGYLALANQQSVANGYGTLGFINPRLYDLGLTANATTYHDITSGTANSTIAPVVAANLAVGYDVVTGWGSPNGPALLNALTGPDFAITSDTPSLSLVRGNSATINITVAPKYGFTATPAYTIPNLPTGVTATYTANSATSESIVLSSATTTLVTASSLLITATSGLEVRTAPLYLVTAKRVAADFSLSAQDVSAQQLVAAGGTSVITVSAGVPLSGPVILSVGALPTGVTATFDNNSTITTANLTFVADLTAAPGTYPIVITGTGMATLVRSITLNLTITSPSSVLSSGDFEGQASAWAFTQSVNYYPFPCDRTCGYYPRGGTQFAVLGGVGAVNTSTLTNTFTIPASNSKATLNFWMWMTSSETTTTAKDDTLAVALYNSSGTLLTTLSSLSNLNKNSAYTLYSYDLSAYIGQTVTLKFTAVENRSKATAFLIDDVSVIVQ